MKINSVHKLAVQTVKHLIQKYEFTFEEYSNNRSTYLKVSKDSIRVGSIRISDHVQNKHDDYRGVIVTKHGWFPKSDIDVIVNCNTRFFDMKFNHVESYLINLKPPHKDLQHA